MARFDALQAYQAQGISPHPVGTLDELNAHKLPTRIFPSCSEPSNDETVKGCPMWHECDMSYKGLTAAEGGGPRNHCWERMKSEGNGGGIVRNVQSCFRGVEMQRFAADNDEVIRAIADEGEDYELLTTVADPAGGVNKDGAIKWDTKLLKLKVQPFVRLGQNQKLAAHELRASIVERERARRKDERESKKLGIEGTGKPLDKRNR